MRKHFLTVTLCLSSLVSFANTIMFMNFTNCEYTVSIEHYGLHTILPNGTPTSNANHSLDMRVLKIGWSDSWSLSMPIGDVAYGYPPNNNSNANGLPVPPCIANPTMGYTATFTTVGGGNYLVIIN